MERGKGLTIGILTILIAAFIVFVVIMQYNFNNPDFAQNESGNEHSTQENESSDDTSEEENDSDKINHSANTTESATNDEDEKRSEDDLEESSESASHSTRFVTVETLNVRNGPGVDYDIAGVVTIDQELEVEDNGDEWVKVTTEDFTGYVNEKYLSDE